MKINIKTYRTEIELLTKEELVNKLQNITSTLALAEFLKEPLNVISYYLYKASDEDKYITWDIPKKSGGTRSISSPQKGLKRIQQKLNIIFQCIYSTKKNKVAFGFVKGKNIVENARKHISKKYVLNLDLIDFFPSIHFGRIKGLLISKQVGLQHDIAEKISNLCCFKGVLPQGAPTSPILTNMICKKLDNELAGLAKQSGSIYTRYADDITFSTNSSNFSASIGKLNAKNNNNQSFSQLKEELAAIAPVSNYKFTTLVEPKLIDNISIEFANSLSQMEIKAINSKLNKRSLYLKKVEENKIEIHTQAPEYTIDLSDQLTNIILNNGFKINYNKVRIQTQCFKQEVTGLKVNEKVNVDRRFVRQIRAMLHSWEKYGLEKASIACNLKKSIKGNSPKLFLSILQGKIAFLSQVRGKEDELYKKLNQKMLDLQDLDKSKNIDSKRLLELKNIQDNFTSLIMSTNADFNDKLKSYKSILEDVEMLKLYVDDVISTKADISKIQNEISSINEKLNETGKTINEYTKQEIITISAESYDDTSLRKEIDKIEKGLKKEVLKIHKILESEIDNKPLEFIPDTLGILKNNLILDNILMQRAKVYKDFPRFCGYVWKQFEAIVSHLSKEYNIEKEDILDDAGKKIFTKQEYQIIFEKLEILEQFIEPYSKKRELNYDKVFFQYHEYQNLYQNKYLVLTDYTKNCRHIAFHGHYKSTFDRIKKQNENEIFKLKSSNEKPEKIRIKEKSLQLRLDFLKMEKYNAVEEILYEFMQLALGNNNND